MVVAMVAPGLILALIGLTHPAVLNQHTAMYWRNLHIGLLFIFPLLAVPPYLLVRRASRWLRWIVLLLLYGFVFSYTALDLLNGVGAGQIYLNTTQSAMDTSNLGMQTISYSPSIRAIFDIGHHLGRVGSWLYIIVCSIIAIWCVVQSFSSRRWLAITGAVLVVSASISFLDSHIYWPRGAITMLLLSAGYGLLWQVSQVDGTG